MTPDEYRAALKALGLTQVGAGKMLGVSARTAQEYAAKGPSGPAAFAVRLLLALPEKMRAGLIEKASAGGRGMTEHTASFGLTLADPSIPWPDRGSGETALCDRPGWERRTIPTRLRGEPTTIEAACLGELAVNVMIEGEGFAICLAETGWRISYGGRVVARCADAMKAAEAMIESGLRWRDAQSQGYSAAHRETLKVVFEAAEERGEILLDRIFPT